MRNIIRMLVFILTISSSIVLGAPDAMRKTLVNQLVSEQANPARDCLDRALERLMIARPLAVSNASDSKAREVLLAGNTNASLKTAYEADFSVWQKHRSSNAVADAHYGACIKANRQPDSMLVTEEGNYCFNVALLPTSIIASRNSKVPREQLRKELASIRSLPLAKEKTSLLIDQIYDAKNRDEERTATRKVFADCISTYSARFSPNSPTEKPSP